MSTIKEAISTIEEATRAIEEFDKKVVRFMEMSQEDAEMSLEDAMTESLEWHIKYRHRVVGLPRGWRGTAADLRSLMTEQPPHHNSWGAAMNSFTRKYKLLRRTGWHKRSHIRQSHARSLPVYERV